jgi:hypothetical protein
LCFVFYVRWDDKIDKDKCTKNNLLIAKKKHVGKIFYSKYIKNLPDRLAKRRAKRI